MTSSATMISPDASHIPADLQRYAADPSDPASTLSDETALVVARAIRTIEPFAAAELEARVLTSQPTHGIAWQMNLPTEVVTQYEQELFPVRHRLADRDWVQQRVFAGPASDPLPPEDVGLVWRWVAFQQDIFHLESLLVTGDRRELAEFGVSVYLRPDAPLSLYLKLLVAGACEPFLRTAEGLAHVQRIAARSPGHWRLTNPPRNMPIVTQVIELLRAEKRPRPRQAPSGFRPASAR